MNIYKDMHVLMINIPFSEIAKNIKTKSCISDND